jgi:LysM domain
LLPLRLLLNAGNYDASFQPINSGYPSASVGNYLVQTGDTLQSIAQSAYGDRQLWFVIAQANGVMSDADLKVGHSLIIPSKVGSVHNTSDTFKPYNPSELIGDTTPTLPVPPPPDDDDCGGLGELIMAVVAVVVAIYAPVSCVCV